VSVSFDERRGYIGSAPELRSPVTALSLGGLRRRLEALMLPDDLHIVLQLVVVAAVMISASLDYAAGIIAAALSEDEPIVPVRRGLMRG
jgi:hypothetical protein